MLKTLIKKQLLEMTFFLFKNGKNGKSRSKNTFILYALLMVYAVGVIGFLFFQMAQMLCQPLVSAQLDWLYFALVGTMATGLGVIGSVFMSYSSLYEAKDNELLLSMPIPSRYILFSRMTGIYIMSLLFEAITMIPAIAVYIMVASPSVLSIVFQILVMLILPLFAVIISCILGFFIAIIASHLKNKSIVSVVMSLIFLGAYFYLYGNINNYLQSIIANTKEVSSTVSTALYPLYQMGLACIGNPLGLIIFAAIVIAAFALVYAILAHSYIKLTTTKRGAKKTKYKEKVLTVSSQNKAIFKKENSRFVHTPVYMLNCGLGTVFMIVLAVLAVINAQYIVILVNGSEVFANMTPLLACAVISFASGMNNISSPSISLEGKSLWIIQSLPVSSWMVLKSKLKVHFLYTIIPALIFSVVLDIVIGADIFSAIIIPLFSLLFVVLSAVFGLAVNLKFPNLDWTNETVAVKQSAGVMIGLFGNWAVLLVLVGVYFFISAFIPMQIYLIICVAILAIASGLITLWLKKRGTKIFEEL